MSIMMYGNPPDSTAVPGVGRWPENPQAVPFQIVKPQPDDANTLKAKLRERIEWLKRELSMHEAWKFELATLEQTLRAMNAPVALPAQPESDPQEP